MSLLSAAERLAAIDRSEVVFDPDRCLHTRGKFSECTLCYEFCPVGAISPDTPPTFDTESCQGCLACLPKCPTGAYSADDAVAALLKAVTHVEGDTLELLCPQHPKPELGVAPESTGILIRHCLAGLGAGSYSALAAFGFERIVVRGDACAKCKWATLENEIKAQIDQANYFLQAWEKQGLVAWTKELEEPVERPHWEADSPPVSRRELFRMMAHQGQMIMARAIENGASSTERRPGRDRMRLLGSAEHLPPLETTAAFNLEPLNFATVSLSDECSACSACARTCPTDALHFEHSADNATYVLDFTPGLCIDCELCVHACALAAIEIDHAPIFSQVFPLEKATLRTGELAECDRCGALFAARPGVELCPVCEYREKHPFGSMLPPGILQVRKRVADGKAS